MTSGTELTKNGGLLFAAHTSMWNNIQMGFGQKTTTTHSLSQVAQEFDFQHLRHQVVVYAGGDIGVLLCNRGLFQDQYSIGKLQNNRQHIIDIFCFNLQDHHPMFNNILHAKRKATLLKGNFSPGDSCQHKSNKGLGPLAMLAQTPQVISQLDADVADRKLATTITAANHNKQKLGVPQFP